MRTASTAGDTNAVLQKTPEMKKPVSMKPA
jgi:hypothetical protein